MGKNRIRDRKSNASGSIKERGEPPRSSNDEPPAFSFKYVQPSHCLDCCDPEEKKALAEALHKRRDKTWQELLCSDRHGLGCEAITQRWRVRVPAEHAEKKMLAFRFSGKKAMVGFREREIFYILWLDTRFNVYEH